MSERSEVAVPDRLDVEISLVNTSNRELLSRCLASLPHACQGLSWHVTVVDNASDDGSAEMVAREYPWAGLVRNERRLGFSANHNKVLRPALHDGGPDFVVVLNEDTELDPGSLAAMVEYSRRHPDVGVVGPVIRGTDGNIQPSYFPFPTIREQFWSSLRPGVVRPNASSPGWLNGSCLVIRTAALREVGALDDGFFIFYEDTDLGMRLRRAGWRSEIDQSATMLHHGHSTVSTPALGSVMERQMIRSRYLYFRKHDGRWAAAALDLVVRLAYLARALKALLAGVATRNGEERRHAEMLLALTRYDPRAALPHEGPVG
jgi:N-acetylglucosaminyl-diphospho-decaprenol L-rhamnosyltransferase